LLPDLPPQKNRPPRIIDHTPGVETGLSLGPHCKRENFSVNVDDPDFQDQIAHRWFVDPDEGFTLAFVEGASLPRLSALADGGSPSTIRVVTPPTKLFSIGNALVDLDKLHHLTLVISDGEFVPGDINGTDTKVLTFPGLTLPDGGPVTDSSYIDTFTWNVVTSHSPCP
jgi:hypothetical protein